MRWSSLLPPSLWLCPARSSLCYLRYQHRQRRRARTLGAHQTTRSLISAVSGSFVQSKVAWRARPQRVRSPVESPRGSDWWSVRTNSTRVAGGVFGCRARNHLVFVHGPLFDAVAGSPKRLADLDRAAGRRRSGDGTRPDARCRPGTAGAPAPRHRRFLAARSGTEGGNGSPQAG